MEENKYIEETVKSLVFSKKAQFSEINFNNKESAFKMKIIKIICYKNGEYTIENMDNYSEVIKNSVKLFLSTLVKFDLLSLIKIYSPENYSSIIEESIFHMFLKYSNKELLPFYFMIGFYSFLNLKEDHLQDIRIIQSDEYFKEANLEYINSRRKILPAMFKNYRRIILNDIEDNNPESKICTKEDLKTFFIDYSSYNTIYCKGKISILIDSLFQCFTSHMHSILLTKGNSLNSINILIKLMIKYFSDMFLEDKYYDDDKLSDNIDFLIEIINEFINYRRQKLCNVFCRIFQKI